MTDTGVTRPVDNLGRVVIPIEIRNKLGIKVKDKMQFYTNNNDIILRKHQQECIFCGKQHQLVDFKMQKVCQKCYEEMREVFFIEGKEMSKM